MIKREQKTFQTYDVYLSAFLSLSGLPLTLEKINGSKIVFSFLVNDDLYPLMSNFNSNVNMPVGDFVTEVKKLRGQMLTMRGQK